MFRVKLVYDQEDMMALFHATWPRRSGRWYPILRRAGLVVGILLIAMAVAAGFRACAHELSASFSGGGYRPDAFVRVGIIFTAALGLSLAAPNSGWFWKRAVWKNYKEKGTELEFCFSEDGFTVTVPTCSSDFSYAGIEKIYEDTGHFVLMLPSGAGYVLRKSSFTQGDPAEFGPWLAQKTEKQLIQI